MDPRSLAWLEDNPLLQQAVDELVDRGVLARVELSGAEALLWSDCDLAIFAEHRLGDRTDPRALDEARRAEWCARATTEPHRPANGRRSEHVLWLCSDEGEQVGTVALSRSTLGGSLVYLSSLYVLPTARRSGHVRRTLTALRDALALRGLGLRLDTCWAWQPTIRVYLRLGMMVRMWKRDLTLQWGVGSAVPIIAVGEETASLSVLRDGGPRVLMRARRAEDRLVLEDGDDERDGDAAAELVWEMRSTFALELAMHGWPLVRSREHWEKSRWSDLGPPEALAYRITAWEAWDRAHGWRVAAPRIPGLAYPSWDELDDG